MKRPLTAAALVILLVTAGIAGVVSAEPNRTDRPTTDAATDVPVATDQSGAGDDTAYEQHLARRLAQYDLTDAQIREIVAEASRLEEAGASRAVIRSSVVLNLYEHGVDAPFLYADPEDDTPDHHRQLHRYIESLDVTPEQARELHTMVHRMYEAGADREEIRRAIHAKLDAWDVDRPDGDDARPDGVDRLVRSLVDRYDLNREQAAELERLVRGMLDDDSDRTEIHEAVSRLLESYGIDHRDPAETPSRDRPTRMAVAAAP